MYCDTPDLLLLLAMTVGLICGLLAAGLIGKLLRQHQNDGALFELGETLYDLVGDGDGKLNASSLKRVLDRADLVVMRK